MGVFLVVGLVAGPVALPAARAAQTKQWDARIQPIADAVARLRGLEFEHPVPVVFMSKAAFRRDVRGSNRAASREDERSLDRYMGQLRATGLVTTDLDVDTLRDFHADSVLAYYSAHDERIVVRGKEITPSLKLTLAHELTHALQDQHFDLDKLNRKAKDSEASAMVEALVEGDAQDVAYRYYDELPDDEQRLADDEGQEEVDGSASSDVPDVFVVVQQLPYVLGPTVIGVTRAAGGAAAVDRLFEQPPTDTAALVNLLALQRTDSPVKVAKPALQDGERSTGKVDVFGPFGLYLILATRGDAFAALDVAGAWNGDASRTFRKGKLECMRIVFSVRAGDTRLTSALQGCAATMPGSATVEPASDTVTLTACDPGTGLAPGPTTVDTAFNLLVFRASSVAQGVRSGVSLSRAACVVAGYFQDATMRALVLQLSSGVTKDSTAVVNRSRQIVATASRGCA